jgi:hypothetical protein
MPYIDKRIPNREFPGSSLERIVDQALDEFYGSAALYLTDGVAVGVYEAGVRAAGQVQAFVAALEQVTQSSRAQLQRVHFQLALEAQAATHRAYMAARATGRMAGPYRLSQRDAGGRLEQAILSPEFIRATYDGIGFANTDVLDRMARQWHRLNFGAGAAAGPGPRRFSVHWSSAVVGSFGFTDTPSAPFVLPQGFWVEPGTKQRQSATARGGWFYPARGVGRVIQTKGIRAWQFLDAGMESIANNLGPAYEALYKDWFVSARRGVGPLSRVTEVKVSAPRRLSFRVT